MKRIVPLVYIIGSFFFFELNYRFFYHFMEQYTLFLYTKSFAFDLLGQVGGGLQYVTAYLTQFFYYPHIAPLLLALLMGAGAHFSFLYLRRFCATDSPLWALLPYLLFWIYPLESIATLLVLLGTWFTAWLYTLIPYRGLRLSFGFIALAFLYPLAAPTQLCVGALILLYEIKVNRAYLDGLLLTAWAFLLPLIGMRTFYIVSMREAYFGRFLFHPEHPFPLIFYLTFAVLVLVPFLAKLSEFIKWPRGIEGRKKSLSFLLLLGCMLAVTFLKKDPLEQAYRYDYYARNGDWDAILEDTKTHAVTDQDALIYVNLALSHKGQLPEGLLHFKLLGERGFIPVEPKSRLQLIEASEVAWQVGQVNAAQRYAFVGVLSAERCIQTRLMARLVDAYLVNEEYAAARKYIKILEATHSYHDWAKSRATLLTQKVTQWPAELQAKRKLQVKTDNPFDLTRTFTSALAYLIDDHPDNKAAFDYAMCYLLTIRQLDVFMHYMEQHKGRALPELYQEAICVYYSQVSDPKAFKSYPISDQVYKRFRSFLMNIRRLTKTQAEARYGKSYFVYAQFDTSPVK